MKGITKGPWTVQAPNALTTPVFIGDDPDGDDAAEVRGTHREANARAIAALPKLVRALEAAHYELLTLNPRLSATYRKNVTMCIELADEALREAGVK